MISIYISREATLEKIDQIQEGSWVNVVNPTEEEIQSLTDSLNLDPGFLRSALDEEERSHIEFDDDTGDMLLIVDFPVYKQNGESTMYYTLPLGVVYTRKCLITYSLHENLLIKSFENREMKNFFTQKKSRFVLQILYKNASMYLQYLKQIDKYSESIKHGIYESLRNKEIVQLLELENSLVYFNTALRANEIVIERLLRYEFIKKYPEDEELLEDTIVENKQAIEMARIYSDILSGTMDAFASIISNNQNIQMRLLTSITIIMSAPNVIFGMFGQNLKMPFPEDSPYAFFLVGGITLLICYLILKYMGKRNMLK